jgi:glycogen debranching enzyme
VTIRFGHEVCGNLEDALRREWLETNGLGGFASSTIIGLNSRRYHGLLVAPTKPPLGRYVLLSKLEETLLLDSRAFDLSANLYPSVVHPQVFATSSNFASIPSLSSPTRLRVLRLRRLSSWCRARTRR